jgi:MFS transporter, DHA2 family, multidrug resistance protein
MVSVMTASALTVATAGTRKWWALGALTLAVLAVGLDATVLSVALPTLAVSLHASATDLQWFVSAYTLALAVGLLPGGLLGDRFGRKKLMVGVLTVFGLGSLACAYSPNAGVFIAARTLLGLSAGFLIPLVISVVAVMFTEEELPKALGIWGAANFLGLPIGPILGGWLLSHYWWGWVFLMNLPVVVIGIIAVMALVPESRASKAPGLDPGGILGSCAGLGLLSYGFIAAGRYGWTSPNAIAAMAAGAAILVAFVGWELRLTHQPCGQPLVDPNLFRSANFTWGTILAAFGIFAMFGLLFAAPQFFQAVLGTNAMGSGLRLLPMMGGLVAGLGLAALLMKPLTAKLTAALGFAVLAAGLVLGTSMSAASSTAFIATWTAITGIGFGLSLATAVTAALVDMPKERSGVASAVMQAVQKAGAPLSAAVLGSVLASGYHAQLHLAGLPATAAVAVRSSVFAGIAVAQKAGSAALLYQVRSAFVHGIDSMLWVGVAMATVGVMLALLFLPWHATATATTAAKVPQEGESAHERAV